MCLIVSIILIIFKANLLGAYTAWAKNRYAAARNSDIAQSCPKGGDATQRTDLESFRLYRANLIVSFTYMISFGRGKMSLCTCAVISHSCSEGRRLIGCGGRRIEGTAGISTSMLVWTRIRTCASGCGLNMGKGGVKSSSVGDYALRLPRLNGVDTFVSLAARSGVLFVPSVSGKFREQALNG
jgi:hypothetical protein